MIDRYFEIAIHGRHWTAKEDKVEGKKKQGDEEIHPELVEYIDYIT